METAYRWFSRRNFILGETEMQNIQLHNLTFRLLLFGKTIISKFDGHRISLTFLQTKLFQTKLFQTEFLWPFRKVHLKLVL